MPKHEPFTPKAIGKRIKSKGLQKLKWFCQMCSKQCRDENGFKCHTSSEGHQRQLLLFAENPNKYMDEFSGAFLKDFLYILRTRFGTKRTHSNQVYQEYIKDRNHLHMNATRWVTLTGFCKWLGRKGICHVDQTEKGWFMTYIDRDPETLKHQENLAKKAKMEKDYDERMAKTIELQVERGKQQEKPQPSTSEPSELKREDEEKKITFSMSINKIKNEKPSNITFPESKPIIKTEKAESVCSFSQDRKRKNMEDTKKKSTLAEIIEEQERWKAKKNKRDNWLTPNIVVKIVANKLGEKYYNKKGLVLELVDKYTGHVKMIDSGDVLKLDQQFLETVIPSIGKCVKVVNGAYIDCEATLIGVDFDRFSCKIKIETGPTRGRIVEGVKFEEISKLG